MLDVNCAHCGRVLIGTRQIVGMRSSDRGIEVAFVCGCGRPGGIVTGRRARRRALPVHAENHVHAKGT